MKVTRQKEAILAAVHAMTDHPTADEVYVKLRENFPRLSLGTVYRNLNTFAQNGEIRKIVVPGGSDRFDHRLDRHEHLFCKRCGRVVDVNAHVDIKFEEIEAVVEDYSLLLRGLCPKCRLH